MLKTIKIKGYKSFKDIELNLKPINVLIGANGSGKSNFISFLKLLRSMLQNPGQLQLFIGRSGGANALLFDGAANTAQIEAELTFETDAGKNDYFFRLVRAAGDTLIFAEEKYRFSNYKFPHLAVLEADLERRSRNPVFPKNRVSEIDRLSMPSVNKKRCCIRNASRVALHQTPTLDPLQHP